MLIKKLLDKLLENRETKKWFINSYLPCKNYFTIMNQINRNSEIQTETEEAIKKYLAEK